MTDKHYPQYDQLGELYDLAYGGDASGTDFYLYLSLAQETGSDVLEMGAGTGRICIALAALGIKVVGLELSREMIQLSHKKIAESLTEDQKKNIHIVQGDMCTMDLKQTFGLVIFPYSSLLEVGSSAKIKAAVKNAYRMLKDGGVMVIDNFFYGPGGSSRKNAILRQGRSAVTESGRTVKFSETDFYDKNTGETERWLYADYYDSRGIIVEREVYVIKRIYVQPKEMNDIIIDSGFSPDGLHLFGAFDQKTLIDDLSFRDSKNSNFNKARQVWICKK